MLVNTQTVLRKTHEETITEEGNVLLTLRKPLYIELIRWPSSF
jgi:hypothetical protein